MRKMSGSLSISVEWSKIGDDKCERTFALGARERDALARIFGLLELRKLVVEVEVRREDPGNLIFRNLENFPKNRLKTYISRKSTFYNIGIYPIPAAWMAALGTAASERLCCNGLR